MITYNQTSFAPVVIAVYLDKKLVGAIRGKPGGYFYRPKGGSKDGHHFSTVAEVKRSVEGH